MYPSQQGHSQINSRVSDNSYVLPQHQVFTVSIQNPAAPARNDGELQSSMDFSMPLYVP